MVDANLIKPKRNKLSDKYSWNLYQYLKKHSDYRVYWIEKDRHFDNMVKFDERIEEYGEYSRHLIIGFQNVEDSQRNIVSYSGTYFNDVLRKPKSQTYSFMLYDPNWFTDITDWFMNKYIPIGRCAFDPEHTAWLLGDEDRWIQVTSNSKKCRWCGEWFKRRIEKEVQIKRRPVWVSQKETITNGK